MCQLRCKIRHNKPLSKSLSHDLGFCLQAVLLSAGERGVGEGEAAAGLSDQRGHPRGTLPCQQGVISGDGCLAGSGRYRPQKQAYLSGLKEHSRPDRCLALYALDMSI